jgi:tetratricopeptide (TPR) repeat protein
VDAEGALNAYNAGLAASESGQIEESVQQFELSVQLNPGVAAVHQALANAYYAMGRYPEALASFDMALQLEPNDELRAWVEEFRNNLSAHAA